MEHFCFDKDMAFEENVTAMITAVAGTKPAFASILERHLALLLEDDDNAQRRSAREAFNTAVRAELDALLVGSEA